MSKIFSRDDNYVPATTIGFTTTKSITLVGDQAAVNVPLFHITGVVDIQRIYGVVTTDLGANHTAAYWRLNDQTAQADITLNTGTTLSAIKAGSFIAKKGLKTTALVKLDNATGIVSDPTSTLVTNWFSPFVTVKKTGAITDIEYCYTTTDHPTTGAIEFFVIWLPISDDGDVSPI